MKKKICALIAGLVFLLPAIGGADGLDREHHRQQGPQSLQGYTSKVPVETYVNWQRICQQLHGRWVRATASDLSRFHRYARGRGNDFVLSYVVGNRIRHIVKTKNGIFACEVTKNISLQNTELSRACRSIGGTWDSRNRRCVKRAQVSVPSARDLCRMLGGTWQNNRCNGLCW